MPKWGNVNERRNQLHEVIRLSGMNLIIDDTDHPLIIKVASIQAARMQVYFIDNDDYFQQRLMKLDENGVEYNDNDERAIFYARGVLETVKKLRWCPDIIHCQGWLSFALPLYAKLAYNEEPSFANSKIITSLSSFNNKEFEAEFKTLLEYSNITKESLDKYPDNFDIKELYKLAIDFSDGIIVSDKDVDPELIEYAKAQNKNVLEYSENNNSDAFNEFYSLVCP
jgi:starch synthase